MQRRVIKNSLVIMIVFSALGIFSCGKNNGDGSGDVPNLSINDISLNEGNSGNSAFDFEVSLSKAYSKDVTFQYRTVEGEAKYGQDLVEVSNQSLTIKAG